MRIQQCRIFERIDIFNVRKDNPERLELIVIGKTQELENLIKMINMECAK